MTTTTPSHLARALLLACVLPLLSTLGGCTTLADVREARGQGTVRFYQQPAERVWGVVPNALNDVDLAVAGSDAQRGYYLAQRGATLMSRGENVAVFVDDHAENMTRVEVVSKARDKGNLTATNFETIVLDAIGVRLDEADRQGP
ncbi:MAG: putative lipoprotein [Phycisphaerales bacterium]|jgi:uncharacterized lipoprotein